MLKARLESRMTLKGADRSLCDLSGYETRRKGDRLAF